MRSLKPLAIRCLGVCLHLPGQAQSQRAEQNATEKTVYLPTRESLKQWTTPQWLEDAVLGVYTHWGPYSVPCFVFTLPEEQIQGLKEIGAWMKINKEALYAARPAPYKEGGTDQWQAKDGTVRFTEKGDFLIIETLPSPLPCDHAWSFKIRVHEAKTK